MRIEQTRKLFTAGILPKPHPTQDVGALAERLEALRLVFAAEHLSELVSRSVKEDWSVPKFLDELLRLEIERQEERRVVQAIRISHLPTGPTISNFDFAYQPTVSRSQIETLSTCQWIRDSQGLLLQGPPGVGKPQPSQYPAGHRGMRGRNHRYRSHTPAFWENVPAFRACNAAGARAALPR